MSVARSTEVERNHAVKSLFALLVLFISFSFTGAAHAQAFTYNGYGVPSNPCGTAGGAGIDKNTGLLYGCGTDATWHLQGGASTSLGITPGVSLAGTVGNGMTDDSAVLLALCSANGEMWLPQGKQFFVGSSITLPCVVHPVATSGFVVANGVTLTFAGDVIAPNLRIFTLQGSGGIHFTSLTRVPVEWFGAVGDGVLTGGGSGTDNTTAIQQALSSLSAGQAILGPKYYRTTSPIVVNKGNVGIKGTSSGYSYPSASPTSILFTTTASTDILQVTGTPSSLLPWNNFADFAVQRTVAPTGTAAGINASFTVGSTFDHVQSDDSIRN